MANLTTHQITHTGAAPVFDDAELSDTAEVGNGHNTFVVYKNSDSNAKTVTVTVPGTTDYGEPNPEPAIALAANTGEAWIPMRKDYDAGDGTGRATLTVSGTGGVTGVTVAVVRMN